MSIETKLRARSESACELCTSSTDLAVYEVAPTTTGGVDDCAYLCQTCRSQIDKSSEVDVHHWRCLNESMWSQVPAVQVLAWRMLTRLSSEGWTQDLDTVGQFLKECMNKKNGAKALLKESFEAYCDWCMQGKVRPKSQPKFISDLKIRKIHIENGAHNNRIIPNWTLRE